jgi:hypothetical protein
MTAAEALLIELAARGIAIQTGSGRLRLRPRSALSAALIERVRAAAGELAVLLRGPARSTARASAPGLDPLEWWVLWAVAQSRGLTRAGLRTCAPAPGAAVDGAVAALLGRRELRLGRGGVLSLHAC